MKAAKTRILHVEDDPGLQDLVRTVLETVGGHEVCSASDGVQALALAPQRAPQFLLLDLNLPGMDGIAALRALRELPGLRAVPAVFLTGAEHLQLDSELRELGVSAVMVKPFRPRKLLELVERVISERA
jgi:two-component system OmpR family response regulator